MLWGTTRLREDTGINGMGQKDPEKLYWERKLEVLVAGIYGTHVVN